MFLANYLIVILTVTIKLFTLLNPDLCALALILALSMAEAHRCYLRYIRVKLDFPKCFHFGRICKSGDYEVVAFSMAFKKMVVKIWGPEKE